MTQQGDAFVVEYIEKIAAAARSVDRKHVLDLAALIEDAYATGRGVFVIGNGGSAANASHFAQDLTNLVPHIEGKRLRVLSLTDNVAYITAVANDRGYDRVFEEQLRPHAKAGDILIAISGSGKSPNIVRCVTYAKSIGMTIVGFTGFDGGQLLGLADVKVHVPLNDMCMAEAVHSILMHLVRDLCYARLRGAGPAR